MGLFDKQCREVNMVITTAMIPGKPAPKLITKEMVDKMKPGEGGRQTIMEQNAACLFFVYNDIFLYELTYIDLYPLSP